MKFAACVLLSVVVPAIALKEPKCFHGDNRDVVLPEYPPLNDFTFRIFKFPKSKMITSDLLECYYEFVRDEEYQSLGYSLREFYQCNLEPFWEEFNKKATDKKRVNFESDKRELASVGQDIKTEHQTEIKSEESSEMTEASINACQLAENAQGCIVAEQLVDCLRYKGKSKLMSVQFWSDLAQGAETVWHKNKKIRDGVNEMNGFVGYICNFLEKQTDCFTRGNELGFGDNSPHLGLQNACSDSNKSVFDRFLNKLFAKKSVDRFLTKWIQSNATGKHEA